jgi:lipopolysaccharide/colanic/teichoic acid biosynthesis glycosyltransferase
MDLAITKPQTYASRRPYTFVKRIVDLLLCVLLLPFALPVVAICALLIRLDSRGPAFFIQERIGKEGTSFRMYKLRTMQHNLDNRDHRAFMQAFVKGQMGSDNGGDVRRDVAPASAFKKAFVGDLSEGSGGTDGEIYKPIQASQVTRVGRVLRKASLDELPQIINVFKGEMSFVGPRPNVPYEVEAYDSWHYGRLDTLPGITGLAQVRGRSSITFDRIVQYDLEYIENQSLWMDVKILWWTVSSVLFSVGAG